MNISSSSRLIRDEFNLLSRKLTYMTAAVLCVVAFVFWWLGVEVEGHMATLVGFVFIAAAVFTFQLPYITYRYMLRKYRNEPEKLAALGSGWREFKMDLRKGGDRGR